jgi:hypothetical protein
MGITWTKTPEDAWGELATAYASEVHKGVYAICQYYAAQISNWMKANAPWTDRTGNARQALYTDVEQVVNQMVTLILSHGVEYGIFLETLNAGRYAIIGPALDHFAILIWRDVRQMLGR